MRIEPGAISTMSVSHQSVTCSSVRGPLPLFFTMPAPGMLGDGTQSLKYTRTVRNDARGAELVGQVIATECSPPVLESREMWPRKRPKFLKFQCNSFDRRPPIVAAGIKTGSRPFSMWEDSSMRKTTRLTACIAAALLASAAAGFVQAENIRPTHTTLSEQGAAAVTPRNIVLFFDEDS